MPRKKKKEAENERINRALQVSLAAPALQEEYARDLTNDPKYSLLVDPENKLGMTDAQKAFTAHYVQFKNVATAADLAGISMDEAKQCFISYNVQQEIRRINRALYHRQFLNKLITIDELGGYLTSLLTDENVPVADQLRTTDKLRVVDMLIKLNEIKGAGIDDPATLANKDFDYDVRELSVEAIQSLLSANDTLKQKNEILAKLNRSDLTTEEKEYLKTLPLKDLMQLIEDLNGGD